MKNLLFATLLILVIAIGGFVYKNAIEHPSQPIVCPVDALICPDGTAVARTGTACTFPACPPPNVSLPDIGVSFAIPTGFSAGEVSDPASIAAYDTQEASSTSVSSIVIRDYAIAASSTALATIQQTAIGGASGAPVSATAFTSTVIGSHRFTVVSLERFEGVIDTAYYLARAKDVLRFDAIDTNTDWTNPNLDVSALRAHAGVVKLLSTLQGN